MGERIVEQQEADGQHHTTNGHHLGATTGAVVENTEKRTEDDGTKGNKRNHPACHFFVDGKAVDHEVGGEIHECAYRGIIEHADYGDEPKANVANNGYEVGKAEYLVAIVIIACRG